MANLTDEIKAYETARADLEARFLGRWVLFHERQLVDTFDCFENAADNAVRRFGRGPYLIRQVGAGSVTLPVSVLYNPVHAEHDVRLPDPGKSAGK
jgi:hypothetical protein